VPAAAKQKHHPKRRENNKVLGIGQDISDIKLISNDRPLLAVIGGAVLEASITRTIGGASNIQITVHDPERKLLRKGLLNEKWEIHLDGLHFRYKGVAKEGPDLILKFIELNAARLQEVKGARKAFRDQVTRAEFILSQVREAPGPDIPVRIYELHKSQPIKNSKEVAKEKNEKNSTGEEHTQAEPGLGKADIGSVTVKHAKADAAQVHIINEVLDVGMSMGASFKLLIASIMTITQETDVINENAGAAGIGPFSQEPGTWGQTYPGATNDVGEDAHGFFQVGLKEDKANPSQSKADLCQAVQNSGAGASYYARWESEATATVERYLGGSSVGSVSQTVKERYAFERAKKEDAWKNSKELAAEVKWRRFMVAGKFFYVPDAFLLTAKRRAVIDEEDSGIDSIDFEMHENVEIQEVTVTCRAAYWKVPPGCVVELSKQMGPAAGTYVVENIEGSLFSSDPNVTIKLHKSVKALKEPAPETKTKSLSIPGGGSSDEAPPGMPSNVVKMLEEAEAIEGTPYLWGGGHASAADVKTRLKKYDCSGAVSRILYVGGYISSPATSGTLAGMYEAGKGEWFTIYANSVHVWIEFRTVDGWRAWEEGGNLSDHAGWSHESTAGYTAVHPKGT
jgi:hypothetical protein